MKTLRNKQLDDQLLFVDGNGRESEHCVKVLFSVHQRERCFLYFCAFPMTTEYVFQSSQN